MEKKNIITVKDVNIRTMTVNDIDYICITDIARQKNDMNPNGVIGNWMRNRNTVEFLGIWETLHNPAFNPLEFEGFRKEAGLNACRTMTTTSVGSRPQTSCGPKGKAIPFQLNRERGLYSTITVLVV